MHLRRNGETYEISPWGLTWDDEKSYAKKVFGMFSGEERMVRMICENRFARTMIDRFGREVMMHPVDAAHFVVSAAVNVSPQFFGWLVALGKGVVIEGLEDVRDEFTGWVRTVMREYEE